jgi:general secretion pathway protein I
MVALAILATSLVALSEVVAGALRNEVRARNLELATLLARGKLAEVEDHYEWKGFAATDESDEGTFEEEGHPEVRWQLEIVAPPGTVDGDQVLRAVAGTDLQGLLPPPFQGALTALLQPKLQALGETVKKGLREVRLTVSWSESGREESFLVKTHMLVLAPGETVPR